MLRLTRMGRKKRPFYRIVALDKRTRRDGKYIEKIGHYDPLTDPITLVVDHDAAIKWMQVGAQMSDTVKRLFTKDGVMLRWDLVKSETAQTEIEEQVKAHQAKNNKGPVAKAKYTPTDPEPIEPPKPKEEKKAKPKAEEAPAEDAKAEEKPADDAKVDEKPAKEAKPEKAKAPKKEAKAEEKPAAEEKPKKAAKKAEKAEEAPAKEKKEEAKAEKPAAEEKPKKAAKKVEKKADKAEKNDEEKSE